jgi:hypothetical protein
VSIRPTVAARHCIGAIPSRFARVRGLKGHPRCFDESPLKQRPREPPG